MLVSVYFYIFALFFKFKIIEAQVHRDISVVIGNDVILPCSIDHITEQQVVWKDPKSGMVSINEQIISDDSRFTILRPYQREWNLQIENVRESDKGIYTCVINTSPRKDKSVSLDVYFPPTIIGSSSDVITTNIGEEVIFYCNATGYPDPVIKWYKHDFTGTKEEIARDTTRFKIESAEAEDGGTYECEADNDVRPSDEKSFILNVQFLPKINIPYEKVTQELGKITLIECIVEANPILSIRWQFNGKDIQSGDRHKIHTWDIGTYTKTLGAFIYNLKKSDFGDYTCIATNDYGTVTATVSVNEIMKGNARIKAIPLDQTVKTGNSVIFNCSAEGISPKMPLVWWHNNSNSQMRKIFSSHSISEKDTENSLDIDKHTIFGQYNLKISKVDLSDSGEYICGIGLSKNFSARLTVVDVDTCCCKCKSIENDNAIIEIIHAFNSSMSSNHNIMNNFLEFMKEQSSRLLKEANKERRHDMKIMQLQLKQQQQFLTNAFCAKSSWDHRNQFLTKSQTNHTTSTPDSFALSNDHLN